MAVLLGVALVICGALARRYPIAPAILLVLVGVLVGFAPHLRHTQLPPEVVLLLFLPALLYWESLTTSLREIRNNLRVVVLTSTTSSSPPPLRSRWRRTRSACIGGRPGCSAPRSPRRTRPPSASWPATCRGAR